VPHGANAFQTFAVGYEEEIDKDYEAQRSEWYLLNPLAYDQAGRGR
jgi:hypothetical protein